LRPEIRSSSGITLSLQLGDDVLRIESVIRPSAWYGTWSMTTGARYSSRRSSNHFRKVKQPV
jgi:hypothetical protein